MLLVAVIMIAALSPTAVATIRHADLARAQTDEANIRSPLLQALTNMAFTQFTFDGSNTVANFASLLVFVPKHRLTKRARTDLTGPTCVA